MKYMISVRQPLTLLRTATEISVHSEDLDRLRDLVTPDWTCAADIIVYLKESDWTTIQRYQEVLNITIAAENTAMIREAKNAGFKAFWMYPASTYWELRGLLDLDVDQVLLDAPLYFDLPRVKKICGDVELRLVANRCYNNYMVRNNGICGTYIRPEDIPVYEPYISHIEFNTDSLRAERALLEVYTAQEWPGNLNLLLTSLGVDVDNRGFSALPIDDTSDPHYFARRRLNCQQKCQSDGLCKFCPLAFRLINMVDKKSAEIIAKAES